MNKLKQYFNKYYRMVLHISVILIIACAVGDDSPPAQIDDFRISSNNKLFRWTAPGDDANSGKASLYLLRFFDEEQVAEILEKESLDGIAKTQIYQAVQNNFDSATQLPSFLLPKNAGLSELTAVPRFEIFGEKKYFYSIVANDETGSSSPPSKVLEVTSKLVTANFMGESGGCLGNAASYGEFTLGTEDDQDEINRDIIIGDPCLGKVYIFRGGADITRDTENINVTTANVTIIGRPEDKFGSSVSGIGNISGTFRYEEFAIGAPGALNSKGQVFILEGNRNLPSTIDMRSNADESARFIITGESDGDQFGYKIVQQGFNNFFISAPSALSETGKVYRFIGNNLLEQTNAEAAEDTITGKEAGEKFGYSIIDGGRINSSVPNELIVGAPGEGRVYIFFNTGTFNLANLTEENMNDVLTISGNSDDSFGEVIGGGFDIDGIRQNTDVVVSAPSADNNKGSVFIYSDEILNEAVANNDQEIDFTEFTLRINGEEDGDKLGTGLVVIPDINPSIRIARRKTANVHTQTQGNADIAIGAPGFDSDKGKVYFIFGGIDDTEVGLPFTISDPDIADHIILSPNGVSSFGSNLNNVLDTNGDNFFDITIGGDNSLTLAY